MVVSWVLTYVKADDITYFKYMQSTVLQLYLIKIFLKILMGIGSTLGLKPTIPNKWEQSLLERLDRINRPLRVKSHVTPFRKLSS